MSDNVQVLIASRSEEGLSTIQNAIQDVSDVRIESLVMVNGNADPLLGIDYLPHILLLHSDDATSLAAVAERPADERPILLVIADNLAPDAVKFAVRAGVRDVISHEELGTLGRALEEIVLEVQAGESMDEGRIIAVMNAKGGSGGTFIASNLAHICATSSPGETLILDLDFQFGSLPHYFDVAPKRSLLEALAHVHELDRVAIEAFTAEHSSGLRIMAPLPDTQTATDFDIIERVRALVPILKSRYRQIIVDVPRHVDEVSSPILHEADQILVVLQQSLPSIRDAVRLKTTLVRDMGINTRAICAVINRHLKSGTIELSDIKEALGEDRLFLIPNNFKSVGQSIDMGIPIAEFAPATPVVKALQKLQSRFVSDASSVDHDSMNKGNTAIERLKQWSPF
jgi:pilus assembly protein CpaE